MLLKSNLIFNTLFLITVTLTFHFVFQETRRHVMWVFPFIALFVIGYIPEMTAPVYTKIVYALLAAGGYIFVKT